VNKDFHQCFCLLFFDVIDIRKSIIFISRKVGPMTSQIACYVNCVKNCNEIVSYTASALIVKLSRVPCRLHAGLLYLLHCRFTTGFW